MLKMKSYINGSIAISSPNNHGNWKSKDCGQRCPAYLINHLSLIVFINITEPQNFFNKFKAKVNFSETKFSKYNKNKSKLGRLVLNHSTNIEGLIPILQKLAQDINIKTITPAAISTARGRSSKLIIRLSVKTINGYKAIARKGKTAQEVFISTDLSKDELKEIIDIYNTK